MSAKKFTGLYAYRCWLAYYNHFTKDKFNINKYPLVKCNSTTFDRLRFKGSFNYLADRWNAKRLRSVMLANFVESFYSEDRNLYWFLESGRAERAWKTWSKRMRHFNNEILTHSGFSYTIEGSGDVFERFDRFQRSLMSPECFIISCIGTDDMLTLNDRYGQADSFPDYSGDVLFLKKYQMLLNLIDPVQKAINQKNDHLNSIE